MSMFVLQYNVIRYVLVSIPFCSNYQVKAGEKLPDLKLNQIHQKKKSVNYKITTIKHTIINYVNNNKIKKMQNLEIKLKKIQTITQTRQA